jgi:hypothetical protein
VVENSGDYRGGQEDGRRTGGRRRRGGGGTAVVTGGWRMVDGARGVRHQRTRTPEEEVGGGCRGERGRAIRFHT